MLIKGLIDEDFINYKKPSMFILFNYCSFKCDHEAGCAICQNSALAHEPDIDISFIEIASRYVKNPITKAVVFGGLEPFDSIWLLRLIAEFRKYTDDEIVIYTGYTEEELEDDGILGGVREYKNIIVKFGRFIPNQEKHYDEILGVELASPNQYARRIS
jgi:hypothetical protein